MSKKNSIQLKKNRDFALITLTENGIEFKTGNAGSHIIIDNEYELIDFWPGRGRWQVRDKFTYFCAKKGTTHAGSGLHSLMQYLSTQVIDLEEQFQIDLAMKANENQ